jgi:hypothetical protein
MSVTTASSRAKSRDPVALSIGFAAGLKAWPRRLRRRCSFDSLRFAQNDRGL